MSRKNPSLGNQHGNSRSSQLHMHLTEREKKHELWAEMIKHKEEAKQMSKVKPLDNFYIGTPMVTAVAISALYVAMRKRKTKGTHIQREFGIHNQLISRYRRWSKGLPYAGSRVASFIIDNEKELKKAIMSAPMPTPSEVDRLMKLANKNTWKGNKRKHVEKNSAKHISRPDVILNQAQMTSEIPVVDFNFEEKHLSKSDVVVAVIVGAVVGASMAAYLFMSNGAI